MAQTLTTQSLLPWLDPGSPKVHLECTHKHQPFNSHEKLANPFRNFDSFSPLFNLINGCFRTPSGKSVAEVFLLVQKDSCSFSEITTPFSNPKIDAIWKVALKNAGTSAELEAFDSLAVSVEDENSLPLWKSLLYCAKRGCYFHPPCPECGNLLELCNHDEILKASGLPPYRTSLERFLFCPACYATKGETEFFKHTVESIYPQVKSYQELITGFDQLVISGLAKEDFPCQKCGEQGDCYGSERACRRISPFSFYPFRMLVTSAAQLPAEDFIFMLSGATCSELKSRPHVLGCPGRSANIENFEQHYMEEGGLLFFTDEHKRFLEIFYLKIALLEQISSAILIAGNQLNHPDFRLSMGQIWVDFPNFKGRLPHFWNFQVKPVALGIFPSEKISVVRVPESISLYSLALIWFNTLLVNRVQSAGDVHRLLASLLEEENFPERSGIFRENLVGGIFAPGNISWSPSTQQLPQSWQELWQKALGLGWSILKASYGATDFSKSHFTEELSSLAENLKEELFSSVNGPEREQQGASISQSESMVEDLSEDLSVDTRKSVDSEILQVLLALEEKWKADTVIMEEASGNPGPELALEPQLEPEQVLMLEQEESVPIPVEAETTFEEDLLDKTLIISADQIAAMMKQSDQRGKLELDEEQDGGKSVVGQEEEETLEKTMIMNLSDIESMLSDDVSPGCVSKEREVVQQPGNSVDEDLSKTVVISLEELEKLRKGKNGNK